MEAAIDYERSKAETAADQTQERQLVKIPCKQWLKLLRVVDRTRAWIKNPTGASSIAMEDAVHDYDNYLQGEHEKK